MQQGPSGREQALALLAGRAASGPAFFDVVAQALATGLGYRWGGVGLLCGSGGSVEILSIWDSGNHLDPFEYELIGTPCVALYEAGATESDKATDSHVFVERGVSRYFDSAALKGLNVAAYRGEAFSDPDGEPIGHVFAMHDQPVEDDSDARAFFSLVAQRTGAEYNRWQAEEALLASEQRTRAAEQRLRDAIENISDGFALYDSSDRLVLFNRKWAELYGYGDNDTRPGTRYEDLVRRDVELGAVATDPEQYIQQRLAYRRQFRGSFDLQLHDDRWITIRERPTSDGGIVGIQTDITQRMRAIEAVLAEKQSAEMASRKKSEFLAKINHEIRTPLNAIIGFAEIIRNGGFGPVGNPKYVDYAADIVSSGEHVLQLVNNLLDLTKAESGEDELEEEILDIAETVRAALVFVRDLAREKAISTELYFPSDMPKLLADPRKLKQVLVNLLANAVKYTNPGGSVTVTVSFDDSNRATFRISDTGIGIAREDMPEALSMYRRGRASRQAQEGTGLGLPLAASLVELHGGHLTVESEPGVGTTVTVSLPPERTVTGAEPGQARRAEG